MPWFLWMIAIILALALILVLCLALWIRKQWLAIPAEERRPWSEIKKELPGFWPAIKETGAKLRHDVSEEREITRRMDVDARRARRELYDQRREEVRREIRRVGRT